MSQRVVTSTSAAARLDAVVSFLSARQPGSEGLIVAATRGAADDLARVVASRLGATFGLTRFSFTELAARLASMVSGGSPLLFGTTAGVQAVSTRATFDALGADELSYFAPVARLPGFPLALARTLHELRLAGVDAGTLSDGSSAAADLGRLLERIDQQLAMAGVVDRARLFTLAARACAPNGSPVCWIGLPVALVDIPLDSNAEAAFARALLDRAPEALVTLPTGDERARAAIDPDGSRHVTLVDPAPQVSDLWHLRRYVFTADRPEVRTPTGDVRVFSAPGEGREVLEITRRMLDEAERGTRFDDMAVLLRTPQQYLGLLEHACARADVPAYFDRGTRRPDPSGRAFLALLACALEGLSARRFDEYLSLGQVPRVGEQAANDAALADPVPARDEVFGELPPTDVGDAAVSEAADALLPAAGEPGADHDEDAVVFGTLRAPWKWEELVVESAVIGGRDRADGSARWRRRLKGLRAEFEAQLVEACRDDPEAGRARHLRRDLTNLAHLTSFALPVIDLLAEWPDTASWSAWLERFTRLAACSLKRPERVQRLLAELRPLATITEVSLEEASRVLHDRLTTLEWDPPPRRYGRVFVGTPQQARGRTFRVVFVPGLAERIMPQRPREDPLLLDESRATLDAAGRGDGSLGLFQQDERAAAERLLLRIAVGAAGERLYLSYPRLDSNAEGRARVPSFYALDVVRAITGRVPDHRVLAQHAAKESGASLGWPAPEDPDRAVDDLEHDLAVLRPLLDARDQGPVKGRAHYMLDLNDSLRRSITGRWLRDKPAWSKSDGLVSDSPALTPYLAKQRLGARPYSLSALQRFATCPYQFLLAAIHRLEPWIEPEPLVRLDPLTRGSLFHAVQTEFQREMRGSGSLPIAPDRVADAVTRLEGILERVAAEYEERLAPAIPRVWRDEIDDLRRDLSIWVRRMADEQEWIPEYFEWSFGLSDASRDPRSLTEPVRIDGRFTLRGSVDLIEHHATVDVLRVTDHKTGRNRSTPDLIVGGGTMLQPVLYSMVAEQALGKKVVAGRLYYSTTVGGFATKSIDLNDYTRRQGLDVLTIVDRAIEQGFLVAAPAQRACTWCDFKPVCGPHEEARAGRKASERLADLETLRSMR
ncbi:MAG: PD-(D/E)XK nuclease family protein [Acidimicrobiia bacterium]|nr:PD-(D/E)XK nuclease family protein [Acidimicrobiia bacterium]